MVNVETLPIGVERHRRLEAEAEVEVRALQKVDWVERRVRVRLRRRSLRLPSLLVLRRHLQALEGLGIVRGRDIARVRSVRIITTVRIRIVVSMVTVRCNS